MARLQEPLPTGKQFIVYCDESRHDSCAANPYMGIGGLWVPYQQKDVLRKRLDALARRHGLAGELKWNKVSAKTLEGYKAVIDAFADEEGLRFRVIIVDHKAADYGLYHEGDPELGFYGFYYHMLVKWLLPETSYIIVLDHKVNSAAGRYAALDRRLRQAMPGSAHLRQVTVADSTESRLAQVADLLTGAVTAAWCDTGADTPKAELQRHLAARMRVPDLRTASPSPAFGRFNVFRISLTASA